MKKIITILFTLGLTTLLSGCFGFWGEIWTEALSSIDGIYIREDSKNYEKKTVTIENKTTYKGVCRIQFKSHYDYDSGEDKYDSYDNVTVSLESSDTKVATVKWNNNGDDKKYKLWSNSKGIAEQYFIVTAVGEGSCKITMKEVGGNKAATLTVKVDPEKGIIIEEDEVNVVLKSTAIIHYKNTYDSRAVTWSTSPYLTITPKNDGTAEIYAKSYYSAPITIKASSYDGKKYDTVKVNIQNTTGWSVSINTETNLDDITPGKIFKLNAEVNVPDNINKKINWYSSDETVATVENGYVTAKKEGSVTIYAKLAANEATLDSITFTVYPKLVSSSQFFWGTWIRMDSGEEYVVEENYVNYNGNKYRVAASTENELTISGLGTFRKDQDVSKNIIKIYDDALNIDVPFFRKGGTNLKYKVRVVGFKDLIEGSSENYNSASRAAGTSVPTGLGGMKVKGQSETFDGFVDEGVTDADGYVELEAPIQGDSQRLEISDEDGKIIIVPGLKVENDGDDLGTIPWVDDNDYAFKITGTINDVHKNDGYLYGNNYKTYPMTLTITNITNVPSATSFCRIYTDDPKLKIYSRDSSIDLNDITISQMNGSAEKILNLKVAYDSLTKEYVDTEIKIEITNSRTKRVWIDYVPLRFFAGQMPITISALSTEENTNAELKGFVIYPDGNSKFISVPDNEFCTVYIPVFGNLAANPYKLVFCGATVTGNLSDSTEMFYSVNLDSETIIVVDKYNGREKFYYGEPNDTETEAYAVPSEVKEFDAYLSTGDIDFYTIYTTSDSTRVYEN